MRSTVRGPAGTGVRRVLAAAASGTIIAGLLLAALAAHPDLRSASTWKLAGTSSTGLAHGDLDRDGAAGVDPHAFNLTAVVADTTGTVSPFALYPGARATVVVTVWNSHSQSMQVDRLTVVPGDASASCGGSNLTAGSFTGYVLVPANGSATVEVPLTMSAAAPDACKDVSFPLALSGAGGKA